MLVYPGIQIVSIPNVEKESFHNLNTKMWLQVPNIYFISVVEQDNKDNFYSFQTQ